MRTEELDNMSLKSYVPTSGIPHGIAGVVCISARRQISEDNVN